MNFLVVYVEVVTNTVGQLDKTHFRIEVCSNFPALRQNFEPIGLIIKTCTDVGLPRRKTWRAGLGGVSIQH